PRSRLLGRGTRNDGPQAVELEDSAGVAELREGDAEALVADAEVGAEIGAGARPLVERGEEGAREVVATVVVLLVADELEVELAFLADELDRDGIDRGGGAVLDSQ